MAKIVYGLNQSLDGYVDHTAFGPSPRLFRHFIEATERSAGSVYGRTMYEIMRYWDDARSPSARIPEACWVGVLALAIGRFADRLCHR